MENLDRRELNSEDDDGSLWFDIEVVPKDILPVDKVCGDAHLAFLFPDKYSNMSRSLKDLLIKKIQNLKNNVVSKAKNSQKVQMIGVARSLNMVFGHNCKKVSISLYM